MNLVQIIEQNHVAEDHQRRVDLDVSLGKCRNQLLGARVVQIQMRAMVRSARVLSRNDVIENRPDVFQTVDAIGHGVLGWVSPSQSKAGSTTTALGTYGPLSRSSKLRSPSGWPMPARLWSNQPQFRRVGTHR